MRERDMPPVQLYLDQFEKLHPELMSNIREAFETAGKDENKRQKKPRDLEYWPRSLDPEAAPIKEWGCSTATALFAALEDAGWPRKMIWMFLRDEVEQDSRTWEISEIQKQEFAKVMVKMQNNLPEKINRVSRKVVLAYESLVNFEYRPPSLEALGGRRMVPLPLESLDWLFISDCLLTPNVESFCTSRQLLKRMGKTLWGNVRNEKDLEKGMPGRWQMVDFRVWLHD
jgi:hypothetical protein